MASLPRRQSAGGPETQFGTRGSDWGISVETVRRGIYVYGATSGRIASDPSAGRTDLFIARFDLSGRLVWARQFGSAYDDEAWALEATSNTLYIDGFTLGRLPRNDRQGGVDAFVGRLDLHGHVVWLRQFGTRAGDVASGLTARDGGVYVSGLTYGALPGSESAGQSDAYAARFSSNGKLEWMRQFGTGRSDRGTAVVALRRQVFVVGETDGVMGSESLGGIDVFVTTIKSDSGALSTTRQFGTERRDQANWALGSGNGLYVAGRTNGVFPGEQKLGFSDSYVARLTLSP